MTHPLPHTAMPRQPAHPHTHPHPHTRTRSHSAKSALVQAAVGMVAMGWTCGLAVAQPAAASPMPDVVNTRGTPSTPQGKLVPVAKPPVFKETFATPALIQALRQGGYVLYMRHGNTNNDRPDQPDMKLDDCNTQRPLNAQGRALATEVGKAVAKARIPVGDVWTSPMCRAKDSAQLAFGNKAQVDKLLMYTANLTTVQKQPILANTRRLLSEPVAAGTNRVVVAHAPNLADLMGFFVKPEGTIVVISPLGNQQFRYEASIHPQHWRYLLK